MENFDDHKWYRFWLKSNRGTDVSIYKFLAGDEDEIKDRLEHWCSNTAAWTQSHCQYGYEGVTNPPEDVLAKKIERLQKSIQRNRALLNAYEIQQLQEIVD